MPCNIGFYTYTRRKSKRTHLHEHTVTLYTPTIKQQESGPITQIESTHNNGLNQELQGLLRDTCTRHLVH